MDQDYTPDKQDEDDESYGAVPVRGETDAQNNLAEEAVTEALQEETESFESKDEETAFEETALSAETEETPVQTETLNEAEEEPLQAETLNEAEEEPVQTETLNEAEEESVQADNAPADGNEQGEPEDRTISSDLIRGHINTIILRSLYDGDKYGYEIIAEIERKSKGQYSMKQPSLYSALKRLEREGYVTSYWGGSVGGGRRKYFSLTDEGKEIAERNQSEWEYSRTVIDNLISDREFDFDNTPAPSAVNMRVLRQSTSRVPFREFSEEFPEFDFSDDEPESLSVREHGDYYEEEQEEPEVSEEAKRQEEQLLKREEELARREEAIRAQEEDARKQQEEELARREEALLKREEEAARQEEDLAKREEEYLQKQQEEAFRQREEAIRKQQEALQLAEEDHARREKELQEREELLRAEEEQRRAAEETPAGAETSPEDNSPKIPSKTEEEKQAEEAEKEEARKALEAERLRFEAYYRQLEEERKAEEARKAKEAEEQAKREAEERKIVEERLRQAQEARLAEEEARKAAEAERANIRMAIEEKAASEDRAYALSQNAEKTRQNDRIREMEPFTAEREHYEKMLKIQEAEFKARHERELAEQESRIRKEDEERFRQREQQMIHQNYLTLVKTQNEEQADAGYYVAPKPERPAPSNPETERGYRSVIQKLYNSALKQDEQTPRAPAPTPAVHQPAPQQTPRQPHPAAPAQKPKPVSSNSTVKRPAQPPAAKRESEPRLLGRIDFYDLESRAAQDGIRITTAGGRRQETEQIVSHNLFHKGRALFFSALVVFLLCIAEGSVALGFQSRLSLPRFYPYFIWGTGLALLLVMGLAYVNHYGERSLRQTGNWMINTIIAYALCVILILIFALLFKIDFSDIGQLATYIIFPLVYFFGIVVFGVTYCIQVKPEKED